MRRLEPKRDAIDGHIAQARFEVLQRRSLEQGNDVVPAEIEITGEFLPIDERRRLRRFDEIAEPAFEDIAFERHERGVVVFPNPAGLSRSGQNLFRAGGGSGDPIDTTPGDQGSGTLQQRFLEGSNVQIVEEMVRMITAQRAYEINSKAIQSADEMLGILNGLKR